METKFSSLIQDQQFPKCFYSPKPCGFNQISAVQKLSCNQHCPLIFFCFLFFEGWGDIRYVKNPVFRKKKKIGEKKKKSRKENNEEKVGKAEGGGGRGRRKGRK